MTTEKVGGNKVHDVGHTEAAYVIDAEGYQRALFVWLHRARRVIETLRTLTP